MALGYNYGMQSDVELPSDPVVREFVAAVNAGDREAFFALLAPSATMRTAWKFTVEGDRVSRFETGPGLTSNRFSPRHSRSQPK